ncbi:MAG: DUF3833 domain-containing protein [Kiloniellales bacterium]|nr:DUF3833 domain-containing protein [Kiloniellales bacterium]
MTRNLLISLALALSLTGCGSMKPEDFAGREPRLLLEEYFAGKTKALGIFVDRFGNLRRQFAVDIDGTWDGDTLTLVEDFLYDDGEIEQRVWRIRKTGAHSYEGRAGDVIGPAAGKAYGNVLNWQYRLALKVGDSTWKVDFDDWMFLQDDNVIINRAEISKFGFKLGDVTIVFTKPAASQAGMQPEFSIVAAE